MYLIDFLQEYNDFKKKIRILDTETHKPIDNWREIRNLKVTAYKKTASHFFIFVRKSG